MFIDVHILQTVSPSCINRDETGSPKTATFGGVNRHRVSSQAWKRATRVAFNRDLPAEYIGTRTKKIVELVVKKVMDKDNELQEDKIIEIVSKVFSTAGIKVSKPKAKKGEEHLKFEEATYLYFISKEQIEKIANFVITKLESGSKITKNEVKAILKADNSIDLSLFGRMVAEDPDLNVDASCQVAHAISTHAVAPEFDYFTAVDDEKASAEEEKSSGAGMIGTVEFISSCLYRYATINTELLRENLGNVADAKVAVEAFIKAFALSMPTGKANTFANHNLPAVVLVALREDMPVSLAAAFEKAVKTNLAGGYLAESVKAMKNYLEYINSAFGTPIKTFICVANPEAVEAEEIGEALNLKELAKATAELSYSRS